jgi:hypothetical protein
VGAQPMWPRASHTPRHTGLAALAAVGYAALALAATWPLATRLAGALPLGTGLSGTVPLASAWSLWWVADRLAAGLSGLMGLWNAPIFHPIAGSFAFSETLLLGGVLTAPVLWLGGSPALAHNTLLLASLVANGVLGLALLRAMGVRPVLAVLGGAALELLPYVHYEIAVLTLVPIWGVLWILLALHRLARAPSLGAGLSLGLAAAATSLLCAHYALFVALAIGPAACGLFGRRLLRRELLRPLAVAAAVAAVLAGPAAWAQLSITARHHFVRSLDRARDGSATADGWRTAPAHLLLGVPPFRETRDPEAMALFPGVAKSALALLAFTWGWRRRRGRRWRAFLLATGACGALLSVAARVEVGGWSPYAELQAWIPGLAQARSLWRAGLFTQVAVALAAGWSLEQVARWGAARARSRRVVQASAVGTVALGVLCAVEVWPPQHPLLDAPSPARYAGIAGWLRENLAPGDAVLDLPAPSDPSARALEGTARWMYATAWHHRPLVSGYSSYFPERTRRLLVRLMGCPGAELYRRLPGWPVRALLVDEAWLAREPACGPPPDAWREVHRDPALGLRVFLPAARDP